MRINGWPPRLAFWFYLGRVQGWFDRHVTLAGVDVSVRQVVLDALLGLLCLAAFVGFAALLVAVAG